MAKRINELGAFPSPTAIERLGTTYLGEGVRGGTTFPIDQNDETYCITFDDVLKTTCNKVGQSGFHVTSGFTVDHESSTSTIKLSGQSGAHTYIDSFYDSNNIHGDGANVQWTRFSSKTDDGTATYHLAFQAGKKDLWRSKVIGSPVLEKLDFGTTDITGLENRVTTLENKQHVGVAGVHVAEEPPATTTNGALWWDTNTASMYVFDSDAWVVTNPGGAGGAGGGTGSGGGSGCAFSIGSWGATTHSGEHIFGHISELAPGLTNIEIDHGDGNGYVPITHDPYTPRTDADINAQINSIIDAHGNPAGPGYQSGTTLSIEHMSGPLRDFHFWGDNSTDPFHSFMAPRFRSDQGTFEMKFGGGTSHNIGNGMYMCIELPSSCTGGTGSGGSGDCPIKVGSVVANGVTGTGGGNQGNGVYAHVTSLVPGLTNIQVQRNYDLDNPYMNDPNSIDFRTSSSADGPWYPLQHDPYIPFPEDQAGWTALLEATDFALMNLNVNTLNTTTVGHHYPASPDTMDGLRNFEFHGNHYRTNWDPRPNSLASYFKSDQGLFKKMLTSTDGHRDMNLWIYVCVEVYGSCSGSGSGGATAAAPGWAMVAEIAYSESTNDGTLFHYNSDPYVLGVASGEKTGTMVLKPGEYTWQPGDKIYVGDVLLTSTPNRIGTSWYKLGIDPTNGNLISENSYASSGTHFGSLRFTVWRQGSAVN